MYGTKGPSVWTECEYWQIATFYESHVIAGYVALETGTENGFQLSNRAALRMQSLPVPAWNFSSTMKNISIILAAVNRRKMLEPHSQTENLECVLPWRAACCVRRDAKWL